MYTYSISILLFNTRYFHKRSENVYVQKDFYMNANCSFTHNSSKLETIQIAK